MTTTVSNRKIIFIEDDKKLLSSMMTWFQGNGNTVFGASKLSEAKNLLSKIQPDILVLDIILPDGSGLDLLTLPSLPPVVILSDLASEENILAGFDAGAADYVVKPCSMRLLEAHIRLRLLPKKEARREIAGLSADVNSRKVFFAGKPVSLTSSEFNILWFLMTHPGTFYSSDEIYEKIWGEPSLQTTTIKRHLSTLRQKLKALSPEVQFIVTEFKKGYSFLPKGDLP